MLEFQRINKESLMNIGGGNNNISRHCTNRSYTSHPLLFDHFHPFPRMGHGMGQPIPRRYGKQKEYAETFDGGRRIIWSISDSASKTCAKKQT